MNALACPDCSTPFVGDDVDLTLRIGKCNVCNRVFPLGAGSKLATQPQTAIRTLNDLALPPGYALEVRQQDTGDWTYRTQTKAVETLRLTRRWRNPATWPLLAFVIAWDAFLVFWYAGALVSGSVFMLLFPVLHVLVGLGLTYTVAANLVNKTLLEVREGVLRVRHTPLPWPRTPPELLSERITQVCVRYTSYQVNRRYRYRVIALTNDGGEFELIGGLTNLEHARAIELVVETFLRIPDDPSADSPELADRKAALHSTLTKKTLVEALAGRTQHDSLKKG